MIPLWFPNVRSYSAAGKAVHSAWKQCSCFSVFCTFVLISSRPTVATVLVCDLLFFSSFCGLSRRCSRCLITWFQQQQRGRKSKSEWRGQETPQSEEFIPCDVWITVPPSDFALFIHVWQSAGSWLEGLKGIQLRQEFISWSVLLAPPQHRPEQIFFFLAWKSNKTPYMHVGL